MYLCDIAVYADEAIAAPLLSGARRFPSGFVQRFHRETCCITELYCGVLKRTVFTPETVKVQLVFTEEVASVPRFQYVGRVALARWRFDFLGYIERDDAGKKKMIFDAIHSALIWIASELKWNPEPLEAIRAEMMRRNLTLEGWSKTSWPSPDRRYRARIGCRFELGRVDFFVGVFDRKRREIGRKLAGSVAPEMAIADSVLKGTGKWRANNTFRIAHSPVYFDVPKSWIVDLSDLVNSGK